MLYNISVLKKEKYINVAGFEIIDEIEIEFIERKTENEARKIALTLSEIYNSRIGDYLIYVNHLHPDSGCYLNPNLDHSPVGESWI